MTGDKFLLDTNIITAWLKGEAEIVEKIDKAKAIYIPVIVVGEYYYGALFSAHIQKNKTAIQNLIQRHGSLPIDEATALAYGEIKSELRKRGKPIPENDIWIAATALRHELVLATRDKHFREIHRLNVAYW